MYSSTYTTTKPFKAKRPRYGPLFASIFLLLLLAVYFSPPAYGQPVITRVEYYFDNDPGYGLATNLSITAGQTNLSSITIPVNPTGLSEGVHRLYVRARSANGWSLTNKWLFYKPYGAGVPPPNPAAPTNISRIEYYFDNDPGYGLATSLSFTPGTNLQNLIIPVNPGTLSEGVHRLYVRAKSGTGWSLLNKWLFYKPYGAGISPPAPAPAADLAAIEYYIDTDPGKGNATPVGIEEMKDLNNIGLFINVTGLSVGEHQLHIRGKDKSGSWSMVNSKIFNVPTLLAAPSLIINSVSRTTLCARDSFNIGYHVTGTFNAGNTFKVFLSNGSGSFAAETEIGTITSIKDGLIKCYLPSHLPDGVGYKLRLKSSNSALTGATSNQTLTIRDRPSAQTITGLANVNTSETWPYNLPAAAGSSWNWMINQGTKISGGTTNSVTIQWANLVAPLTAGKIDVLETNQYGCVGDTSRISPVNIYKLKISNNAPAATCPGSQVALTVTSTGSFYTSPAANQFIAELSNASGSFSSPLASANIAIGAPLHGVNQAPGMINLTIPANVPNGAGYKIRIRSSNPVFIGDTSAAISIQKPDAGPDLNKSYCDGYSYNLTQHYNTAGLVYTYFNASFVTVPNPANVVAGSYRVIATNSQACADTAVVTITSVPSPALGPDTLVYHNCPGETTNLTQLYTTTGLTAVWNTGNTLTAPPGIYRLVVTNIGNCTDTAFATITLETATWTGTISNNWHTAGNWSTGKVPTAKTHVIVLAGTPNPCVVSAANAEAASVQARTGATVQTTNGRLLMLNGNCVTLPVN